MCKINEGGKNNVKHILCFHLCFRKDYTCFQDLCLCKLCLNKIDPPQKNRYLYMHRKFLEEYGRNLTVIASGIWGEGESHFCTYPFTLLDLFMYFQLVGIFVLITDIIKSRTVETANKIDQAFMVRTAKWAIFLSG